MCYRALAARAPLPFSSAYLRAALHNGRDKCSKRRDLSVTRHKRSSICGGRRCRDLIGFVCRRRNTALASVALRPAARRLVDGVRDDGGGGRWLSRGGSAAVFEASGSRGAATMDDAYTVSFNSDTSDSEEESVIKTKMTTTSSSSSSSSSTTKTTTVTERDESESIVTKDVVTKVIMTNGVTGNEHFNESPALASDGGGTITNGETNGLAGAVGVASCAVETAITTVTVDVANTATVDRLESATDRSESATDRSESAVERSESMVERLESVVARSESATDRSESAVEWSESAVASCADDGVCDTVVSSSTETSGALATDSSSSPPAETGAGGEAGGQGAETEEPQGSSLITGSGLDADSEFADRTIISAALTENVPESAAAAGVTGSDAAGEAVAAAGVGVVEGVDGSDGAVDGGQAGAGCIGERATAEMATCGAETTATGGAEMAPTDTGLSGESGGANVGERYGGTAEGGTGEAGRTGADEKREPFRIDTEYLAATDEFIKKILAEARAEQSNGGVRQKDGGGATEERGSYTGARAPIGGVSEERGSYGAGRALGGGLTEDRASYAGARALGGGLTEDRGSYTGARALVAGLTEERESYAAARSSGATYDADRADRGDGGGGYLEKENWRESPYSARGVSPYSEHDATSLRSRYRRWGGGVGRDSPAGSRYGESDGEEMFADSEFEPQRRAETSEVVRDRTSDIRGMVDKQADVLSKLKEASESFDELTNEIRAIKRDFLENQYQRSLAFDDSDDEGGGGGGAGYALGSYYTVSSASMAETGYTPAGAYTSAGAYTPAARYTPARQLTELDPELQSETLTGGGSLRNLARNWSATESRSLGMYESAYESAYATSGYTSRYTAYKSSVDEYSGGASYRDIRSLRAGLDDAKDDPPRTRRPAMSLDDDDDDDDLGRSSSRYTPGKYASGGSAYKYRASSSKYTADYTSPGLGQRYGSLARSRTLPSAARATDSQFSSRFLSKVRDDRLSNGDTAPTSASSKRDRPFKSRFLKKSVDSDYGSYPSSAATTPSPVSRHPTSSGGNGAASFSRYPTFSAARATGADDEARSTGSAAAGEGTAADE